MTRLFRRLQPRQKLRITKSDIAKLLKISKHLIVRFECWAYIVFIHRTDKGGQFLSYRQLQQWQNAVACQIQSCFNWQQLQQLWQEIEADINKHITQYNDNHRPFLDKICKKHCNLNEFPSEFLPQLLAQ